METTKEKPNGGYSRLKIKYNMLLETHKEEMAKGRELVSQLKDEIEDDNVTIERQGHKIDDLQAVIKMKQTRISELTAELKHANDKSAIFSKALCECRERQRWLLEHSLWIVRVWYKHIFE